MGGSLKSLNSRFRLSEIDRIEYNNALNSGQSLDKVFLKHIGLRDFVDPVPIMP